MITHNFDFSGYQRSSIRIKGEPHLTLKLRVDYDIDIIVTLHKKIWDLLDQYCKKHGFSTNSLLYDTWDMHHESNDIANEFINWLIYVATYEAEDQLREAYSYTNDNLHHLPYIVDAAEFPKCSLTIKHLRG